MQDISRSLIDRAVTGDKEAFYTIYTMTSSMVYTIALRIACNAEDAEDIAQEVFIKIYKKLKDFRGKSAFGTWVYRITVNTALNFVRKRQNALKKQTDYNTLISAGENRTQHEHKETDFENTRIASLLALLNPEQRAVLVLREQYQLRYSEISRALRININTVRTRLLRARRILVELRNKGG